MKYGWFSVKQGCSAHFSSLMGYQYHQKRCGRELPDRQKPVFLCQHCGKTYRSKAGRDYHLRTEHPVTTLSTHSVRLHSHATRYTADLTLCGNMSWQSRCYLENPEYIQMVLNVCYITTFSSQLRTGDRKTVKMRRMCWKTKKRRRRKRKNLCK